MDYEFEKKWKEKLDQLSARFGGPLDYAAILMLIGYQELGQEYRTFKKDQKVELMHIGVCAVLVDYGYYRFEGRDEDGWPHFERIQSLPPLSADEQELLIRKAIVAYFDKYHPIVQA
jgi:hypothetical protein